MIIKQPQALKESKKVPQERQKIRSTKTEAHSIERPGGASYSKLLEVFYLFAQPTQELARSSGLVEQASGGILTALLDPTQQSIFFTSLLRFITSMFKSHTLISSLLQELFHHNQHILSYLKHPLTYSKGFHSMSSHMNAQSICALKSP